MSRQDDLSLTKGPGKEKTSKTKEYWKITTLNWMNTAEKKL